MKPLLVGGAAGNDTPRGQWQGSVWAIKLLSGLFLSFCGQWQWQPGTWFPDSGSPLPPWSEGVLSKRSLASVLQAILLGFSLFSWKQICSWEMPEKWAFHTRSVWAYELCDFRQITWPPCASVSSISNYDTNSSNLIGLLKGLSELIYIMFLEQCQEHSSYLILVRRNYTNCYHFDDEDGPKCVRSGSSYVSPW